MREGDEVVYVERATTLRIMRVEQVIGGRAPLHVTAAGKLFLADNGAAACRDYSERTGLPARTPRSIADPERLCRSVRDISRQGYALDDQEAELGVGCIGTPVRDASGRLVAGLSVSSPIERRRDAWIPWVLQAATEISTRLGHCPPPAACIETAQPFLQVSSPG